MEAAGAGAPQGAERGPRMVAVAVLGGGGPAALEGEPPPYSPPDPRSAHLLCPPFAPPPSSAFQPGLGPCPQPGAPLPFVPVRGRVLAPTLRGSEPGGCPPTLDAPRFAFQFELRPGPVPPASSQRPPKDYLLESVLVTIFCCLLTGVVALVYSHELGRLRPGGPLPMTGPRAPAARSVLGAPGSLGGSRWAGWPRCLRDIAGAAAGGR
ncbi:proline rich transmembrane protein 1B isoform 1-T1 [Mergus octosetaceus]